MNKLKRQQKDAFLEAIKLDYFDLATRSAFAGWLQDNGFDDEANLIAHHAEQKDDALLVDRCVSQPTEIDGWAEHCPGALGPHRLSSIDRRSWWYRQFVPGLRL